VIFVIFVELARLNLIIYEKEMYDEKRKRGEIKAAINIGREEGREDAVRRMIAAGLAVEQIAEIMDMTIEQIEALQA
jgi:predicted transposase YdaD